jgi:PAS domain S-box-containing protein
VRPRHIAPVALVLALTVAGFLVARLLAERDARRDSEHRAEVAAAQIRDRVAQGASLIESLRRFMRDASGTGVTSDQFARNALSWLSPPGFAAAAWVEPVPDSRRAAYERRIGQPIVTPDERRTVVPVGSRSSYLPATLVSGFDPMAVPGIDLSGEPGMTAVLGRATRFDDVAATPVAPPSTGTGGIFLVAPAPNLIDGVLRSGYVVVFVSDMTLRAAARDAPTVQITAGTSTGALERTETARRSFTEAGQRFDVLVPQEAVAGVASVVPWIILAAGLVFAGLAAALGVSSVRRTRAQDELDRIFKLSSDLIVVADFDGHFTRVNPAGERILGYTEQELLSRPYLDLVHPDDRERTASEAAAIGHGKTALSFENRYVRKDGSHRVLEWTSTPVVEDQLTYAMARDVTERRRAEAEAKRLADEQAALRRVATLVAREASQAEVFAAIAEEIGQLLGTEEVRMLRYEDDRSAVVVASRGDKDLLPIGAHLGLEDDSTTSRVFRTRRAARIDDYARVSGPVADQARLGAIRCVVATPVVVEGRLWGAITAGTRRAEPLPPDTESRMGQFTELMATAIANTESHARAERLANEQAALRRVATLVAEGAPPTAVLDAVAGEMEALLDADQVALNRFEPGDEILVLAHRGLDVERTPVGSRVSTQGESVTATVRRTGRPARMENYEEADGALAELARDTGLRSSVSAPIVVEGRLWGLVTASWKSEESPPPDTEERMSQFAQLLDTAIANAEARSEVERLAEEQAALRRVATLVAQGRSPTAVFDAVAAEMESVLGADGVTLSRYEPDDVVTVVAHSGANAARVPPGTRVSHHGQNVTSTVRRTERPARMEHYDGTHGAIAELVQDLGVGASVGVPIVVDGGLWGVTIANWQSEKSPPSETEERMVQFAQLLDTAIANADSRHQLTASRARLLTAADEARRRVVRDLHDGAQQRLVHTIVTLKLAREALRQQDGAAESFVGEALQQAEQGNAELRELAHGILPAVLTRGGLRSGVDSVVARLDVPVQVDVTAERLPPEIEASAYFIVAEALTNVVKHAHAGHAEVRAYVNDEMLHVEVRDDGTGGADPNGHGLVGVADRVAALGGRLEIESPAGAGTLVAATLPLLAG